MYVDEKRQGEATVTEPSVDGFIAFCEHQGDRTYEYEDHCTCACQQYAKSIGREQEWYDRLARLGGCDFWFSVDYQAAQQPYNFAALAGRLRNPVRGRLSR